MLKNSVWKYVRLLIVVGSILTASLSQAQIRYYLQSGASNLGWVDSVDMSKMSNLGNTHTQSGSTTFILKQSTPQLMTWIHSGIHTRNLPNCSVLMIGPNGKEMEKFTFTAPSLTSVTLPVMNNVVAVGNQATIQVIVHTTSLTTISETNQSPPAAASKSWSGNKFKLTITGMDSSGVTQISAITFNNSLVDPDGHPMAGNSKPVPVTISVSANSAKSFTSWFNDFTSGKTSTKQSSLVMNYNTGDVALTVDFRDLMIKSFDLGATGGTAGCTISDVTIH